MSTSDPSDFATTDPQINFDAGFGWKFGPSTLAENTSSIEANRFAESDWVALPFSDISDISMFRKPLWQSVERLYLAAMLADDCDCKRQEFSVSQENLSQMGLRSEELKWLQVKNIVERTERVRAPHDRDSHRNSGAGFVSDEMFVITDFGIELVEESMTAATLHRSEQLNSTNSAAARQEFKPSWDNERHELRCAGKIVKKFKWRAANQETILAAFEEEGWPAHVDDPLPQQSDIDPKRRLADAIKSLNRHQKFSLVRFCGDGTGEGVLWEFK